MTGWPSPIAQAGYRGGVEHAEQGFLLRAA